jgi:Ca-activated chloride channel homolog
VPVERASVVLVSDVSGSMAATDVAPSRLDAAKDAADSFLDKVPDRLRVGLVAFSTTPHTTVSPTGSHEEVRAAIEGLGADGATVTGDGLAAALKLVDDPGEKKRPPAAVVLLSDGKTTGGRDPLDVARQARRLGIPIYTVALGTDRGTVPGGPFSEPIPVPPDPETMREIASVSGGRSFKATDSGELGTVYKRLGSQIGTKPEKREITAAFAGGGILLLGAALAMSMTSFARLP